MLFSSLGSPRRRSRRAAQPPRRRHPIEAPRRARARSRRTSDIVVRPAPPIYRATPFPPTKKPHPRKIRHAHDAALGLPPSRADLKTNGRSARSHRAVVPFLLACARARRHDRLARRQKKKLPRRRRSRGSARWRRCRCRGAVRPLRATTTTERAATPPPRERRSSRTRARARRRGAPAARESRPRARA